MFLHDSRIQAGAHECEGCKTTERHLVHRLIVPIESGTLMPRMVGIVRASHTFTSRRSVRLNATRVLLLEDKVQVPAARQGKRIPCGASPNASPRGGPRHARWEALYLPLSGRPGSVETRRGSGRIAWMRREWGARSGRSRLTSRRMRCTELDGTTGYNDGKGPMSCLHLSRRLYAGMPPVHLCAGWICGPTGRGERWVLCRPHCNSPTLSIGRARHWQRLGELRSGSSSSRRLREKFRAACARARLAPMESAK